MLIFKTGQSVKAAGFTLIELMVVIAIIAVLAAVGIPSYTRYINSAKAAEAYQILSSVITYYKSYQRSHGDGPANWCDTTVQNGEWIDEVVGAGNEYFDFYYYNFFGWEWLRVRGKASPFDNTDQLFYFPNTNTWLYTGRLRDVQPD